MEKQHGKWPRSCSDPWSSSSPEHRPLLLWLMQLREARGKVTDMFGVLRVKSLLQRRERSKTEEISTARKREKSWEEMGSKWKGGVNRDPTEYGLVRGRHGLAWPQRESFSEHRHVELSTVVGTIGNVCLKKMYLQGAPGRLSWLGLRRFFFFYF